MTDRPRIFLLSDLGTSDLRAYRPMLHRLHRIRRMTDWLRYSSSLLHDGAPKLGKNLLQDISRSQRDAPIAALIARWEALELT